MLPRQTKRIDIEGLELDGVDVEVAVGADVG